jgi:hypothetical protein
MKVSKSQFRKIIKEEKRSLIKEDHIAEEASLMVDLDSIATSIEDIAAEVYGLSGPGTVSGVAGDDLAQALEMQVERLTAFYDQMVAHFESMDPENQLIRPSPSGVRGDIMTREDR